MHIFLTGVENSELRCVFPFTPCEPGRKETPSPSFRLKTGSYDVLTMVCFCQLRVYPTNWSNKELSSMVRWPSEVFTVGKTSSLEIGHVHDTTLASPGDRLWGKTTHSRNSSWDKSATSLSLLLYVRTVQNHPQFRVLFVCVLSHLIFYLNSQPNHLPLSNHPICYASDLLVGASWWDQRLLTHAVLSHVICGSWKLQLDMPMDNTELKCSITSLVQEFSLSPRKSLKWRIISSERSNAAPRNICNSGNY